MTAAVFLWTPLACLAFEAVVVLCTWDLGKRGVTLAADVAAAALAVRSRYHGRRRAPSRRAWRAWRGWVARQHERAAVRQIERDRLAPEDALTVAWAQGLHRLLPERWDLAALAALRVITETAPASPWRYDTGSLAAFCDMEWAR